MLLAAKPPSDGTQLSLLQPMQQQGAPSGAGHRGRSLSQEAHMQLMQALTAGEAVGADGGGFGGQQGQGGGLEADKAGGDRQPLSAAATAAAAEQGQERGAVRAGGPGTGGADAKGGGKGQTEGKARGVGDTVAQDTFSSPMRTDPQKEQQGAGLLHPRTPAGQQVRAVGAAAASPLAGGELPLPYPQPRQPEAAQQQLQRTSSPFAGASGVQAPRSPPAPPAVQPATVMYDAVASPPRPQPFMSVPSAFSTAAPTASCLYTGPSPQHSQDTQPHEEGPWRASSNPSRTSSMRSARSGTLQGVFGTGGGAGGGMGGGAGGGTGGGTGSGTGGSASNRTSGSTDASQGHAPAVVLGGLAASWAHGEKQQQGVTEHGDGAEGGLARSRSGRLVSGPAAAAAATSRLLAMPPGTTVETLAPGTQQQKQKPVRQLSAPLPGSALHEALDFVPRGAGAQAGAGADASAGGAGRADAWPAGPLEAGGAAGAAGGGAVGGVGGVAERGGQMPVPVPVPVTSPSLPWSGVVLPVQPLGPQDWRAGEAAQGQQQQQPEVGTGPGAATGGQLGALGSEIEPAEELTSGPTSQQDGGGRASYGMRVWRWAVGAPQSAGSAVTGVLHSVWARRGPVLQLAQVLLVLMVLLPACTFVLRSNSSIPSMDGRHVSGVVGVDMGTAAPGEAGTEGAGGLWWAQGARGSGAAPAAVPYLDEQGLRRLQAMVEVLEEHAEGCTELYGSGGSDGGGSSGGVGGMAGGGQQRGSRAGQLLDIAGEVQRTAAKVYDTLVSTSLPYVADASTQQPADLLSGIGAGTGGSAVLDAAAAGADVAVPGVGAHASSEHDSSLLRKLLPLVQQRQEREQQEQEREHLHRQLVGSCGKLLTLVDGATEAANQLQAAILRAGVLEAALWAHAQQQLVEGELLPDFTSCPVPVDVPAAALSSCVRVGGGPEPWRWQRQRQHVWRVRERVGEVGHVAEAARAAMGEAVQDLQAVDGALGGHAELLAEVIAAKEVEEGAVEEVGRTAAGGSSVGAVQAGGQRGVRQPGPRLEAVLRELYDMQDEVRRVVQAVGERAGWVEDWALGLRRQAAALESVAAGVETPAVVDAEAGAAAAFGSAENVATREAVEAAEGPAMNGGGAEASMEGVAGDKPAAHGEDGAGVTLSYWDELLRDGGQRGVVDGAGMGAVGQQGEEQVEAGASAGWVPEAQWQAEWEERRGGGGGGGSGGGGGRGAAGGGGAGVAGGGGGPGGGGAGARWRWWCGGEEGGGGHSEWQGGLGGCR